MRGSRIPVGKRIINDVSFPPLNPLDYSEANADHLMFIWDNMGTGAYLEDASVLDRHLSRLMAREQISPNLTLAVNAGVAWFSQISFVTFAGGNSPSFPAPITNPRIDILTIRNNNTLHVIPGTEAVSPVAPTILSTDIGIAQVYNVVGQVRIRDNDSQEAGQGFIQYDLRPFIQSVIGANAMPKIGLVAKSTASFTNAAGDVVNFTGAGRLRGINVNQSAGGAVTAHIIIDGVDFGAITFANGDNKISIANGTVGTTMFVSAAGASAFTEFEGGIFFKTSLQVTLSASPGTGVGIVAYEHE